MGHTNWREFRKKRMPWYKRLWMDVYTKVWAVGYRRGWWV